MDDQNNQDPDNAANTFTLNLSDLPGVDAGAAQTLAYGTQPAGQPPVLAEDPFIQTQTAPAQELNYEDPSFTDTEATIGHTEASFGQGFDPTLALPSTLPAGLQDDDYHSAAEATYGMAQGEEDPDERRKKIVTTMALAVGLALMAFTGFLFYEATTLGVDPVNHIMASLGLAEQETSPLQTIERARPRPQRLRAPNPAKSPNKNAQTVREAGIVPDNPYWELPNPIPSRSDPDVRQWSTEERVIWKAGISHQYNFQHYKTLKEVRSYQLKGSEEILWKGLKEPKLWSRMSAVMGLAEIGVPVDVDLVEQAIGDARPDLVKNFFKRFKTRRTAGELFVLRQAIKIVDASARLVLLQVMSRVDDGLRDVYLTAATFDPGLGIAAFARTQLASAKVTRARFESLRNFIMGTEELPQDLRTALEAKEPATFEAQKVQEVSTVEKIEFFGGVKSESISEEGMLEEDSGSRMIEIKDEDLR